MEKAITVKSLALSNIRKKPYRTTALTILVALASGVLFGTLLLTASIKGGLSGIKNRIGADLMIVPEGYEAQAESVLLSGEPNYFYMDKSIEETVRGIQGVGEVSSQFYLTSLSESCCDFPIQIIGFDPETDFIVKSWARKKVKSSGTDDEELILAGSNITTEKDSVRFFEHTHKVSARLAKSGTGMDNAIYTDISNLEQIFEDAKAKGFGFISDGNAKSKTSVIFVKLSQGAKPDSTAARIKGAVSGIQVIQSVLITVLTLSIVFNLSINERLREFSILRVLGADFKKLRSIVFAEAGLIGSLGAVLGIFLSTLILLPFNVLISEKLNMPFVLSGAGQLALFALVTFAVLVGACLVASVSGALKVSKHEVYQGIK